VLQSWATEFGSVQPKICHFSKSGYSLRGYSLGQPIWDLSTHTCFCFQGGAYSLGGYSLGQPIGCVHASTCYFCKEGYSLGGYRLGQPILDLFTQSRFFLFFSKGGLQSRASDFVSVHTNTCFCFSKGGYSLGGYSLGQPFWDVFMHTPVLFPREATVGSYSLGQPILDLLTQTLVLFHGVL